MDLLQHEQQLHNETLESISHFSTLSLNQNEDGDHDQDQNVRKVNRESANGDDADGQAEVDGEYQENGSDTSDSSINIKNSNYVESNNSSNGEETIEDQLEDGDDDDRGDANDTNDNNETNEYDDDSANEFLNSSSFLSNSQIIRSANLNNYKSVNHKTISSPTPAIKSHAPKPKNHFQLSSSKSAHNGFSDHSEGEGEEVDADEDDDNEDEYNNRFSRARFDNLDIDNPDSTPKLPKIHPDTTPWRKLRPPSALPSKEVPAQQLSLNFMSSLFDSGNNANNHPIRSPTRSASLFESSTNSNTDSIGTTTVTTSYEIENLRKQITNYKLQQRLLTEFIRNLIKNTGNGDELRHDIMERLEKENDILFSERERLQKDLKDTIGNHENEESSKITDKMKEIVELKNDLIATRDLNGELNSYIDELKAKTEDQTHMINNSNEDADRWEHLINDILSLLLDFSKGESAKAILQARDQSKSLDIKLKVISLAINEILDNYEHLSENLSKTNDYDAETISSFIEQSQFKFSESRKIEQDLKELLKQQSDAFTTLKTEFSSLQTQFKENLLFVASLKKLLSEKRSKITELNDVIIKLEAQLEGQSSATQSSATSNGKETQLLRNRLTIIKTNHSKEVENLLAEIDNLKLKIDELSSREPSSDEILTEELLKRQKEISDLDHQIHSLNKQLDGKDSQADSTLSNIKILLRQTKDDHNTLLQEYHHIQNLLKESQGELHSKDKEYRRKLEHAAKELNLAVAKQRTLAAEKSKLTFALEDSKREHSLLKLNNSTLTEKVGKLSYQVSNLTNYELGFNSLFQLQITNFQNLLNHFDSILEESSVNQAQQKLTKLVDSQLDFDQIHAIMRSLFSYFENATNSLISDHSQLLINSNIDFKDSQDTVNSLKSQIDSLNEELQWYIVNYRDKNDLSPRSKLRIDELEKRRKAERERRKLENQAAEERISKLEKENKELKERLAKQTR